MLKISSRAAYKKLLKVNREVVAVRRIIATDDFITARKFIKFIFAWQIKICSRFIKVNILVLRTTI